MLGSCQGQPLQKVCIHQNFNSYVKANHKDIFINSFNDLEACILQETISKYLNDINDYRLVILDSFQIRHYQIPLLNFTFDFVVTPDCQVHFIALPKLYEYTHAHRHSRAGEKLILNDPSSSVCQMNESELDVLLDNYVFLRKWTPDVQKERANRLLRELFGGVVGYPVDWNVVTSYLNSQPESYSQQVFKRLDEESIGTSKLINSEVEVFRYEPFGFTIVKYIVSTDDKVRLKLFFISNFEGYQFIRAEDDEGRYKECVKRN
jgi:hypothetical protein